jgi:hypothetical protein
MPIPLRSRRYDAQFADEIRGRSSHSAGGRTNKEINEDLFG